MKRLYPVLLFVAVPFICNAEKIYFLIMRFILKLLLHIMTKD